MATVGSRVAFVELKNATASLAASPIAALQAAWAGVLSTYTAVEDDVTYKASPAIHTPGHIQEEISYPIPTRACLGTPQGWGQVTNGSILKGLTESSALALPQHDESSKHGTMIALEGKERFEDGTNSGDRGFKGEELPVSLVAWPDIAGSLKLKLLFTKMALNKTSALVLLKQLDDALAFIFAHLSKVIARSLAATRPSLLPISNEMPEKCTDSGSQPAYLHSHFENTARDSPHRIALDFRQDLDSERSGDGTMWTYEQRNRYASHPPLWPIG